VVGPLTGAEGEGWGGGEGGGGVPEEATMSIGEVVQIFVEGH